MKKRLITVLLGAALGVTVCLACPADNDEHVASNYEDCMTRYDAKTKQVPIRTDAEIDAVLTSFTKKTYAQLKPAYRQHAELHRTFKSRNKKTGQTRTLNYRQQRFYEIKGDDQFKYLVGHFRVVDFLPNWKSPGYEYDPFHMAARELACSDEANAHPQYLLVDPLLLKKFNQLLQLIKKSPKGYDHRALSIYYGFRHPHMNDMINGSTNSQHLWGKALDIEVGDINRDGKANAQDKAIVLDLLERKVIGHRGGIGRYPDSPTEIHMDVRGWYARWDR